MGVIQGFDTGRSLAPTSIWQPVKSLSMVLGETWTRRITICRRFFYPANYFEQNFDRANLPENSAIEGHSRQLFPRNRRTRPAPQLILKKNRMNTTTLFFLIINSRTSRSNNEKFALGFVHRNNFLRVALIELSVALAALRGASSIRHPINTRNDVAQAVGLGVSCRPFDTPSFCPGRPIHLSPVRTFARIPTDSGDQYPKDGRPWEPL